MLPSEASRSAFRSTIPLRILPMLALILAAGFGHAQTDPRAEIDSLLAFVGRQQGIEFLRNGSAHTAQEAESHLRYKLERGGNRIKTAEDFIRYCATRSFFTRIPYRVRYRNGTTRPAADVLNEELRRLRAR